MKILIILTIIFYSSFTFAKDRLEIEIHSKSFLNLLRLHQLSSENNFLKKEFKTKIPIIINNDKYKYKARLGLDGLGEEHWDHDDIFNSTFDIKISNNNFLNTFQDFRLLNKESIYFDSSKLFNYILEYFNQPIRRYSLVEVKWVTLNNKTQYYEKVLEESFSNKILDSNGLREGFLFKYDVIDDSFLENTFKIKNGLILWEKYIENVTNSFENSNIKIIDIRNDLNLEKQYKFFNNVKEKSLHINFDLDQIALLYAIHFIWGDMHSLQTHNAKFYFNPINKKTLFLPTDFWQPKKLNINYKNFVFQYDHHFSWLKKIILDEKFQIKTNYYLQKIINDNDFFDYIIRYSKNDNLKKIVLFNIEKLRQNNIRLFFDKDLNLNKPKYNSLWPIKNQNIVINNQLKNNFKSSNKLDSNIFVIDDNKKIINFKNKNVTIDQPIYIGTEYEDYKLVILENSKINFIKNGKLIIESNTLFNGLNNNNIEIKSETTNGIIIFYGKNNIIKFTNFLDFNIDKKLNNHFLTSPITFYNTNVKLHNVKFSDFKSEDQLNIINSQFEINNSLFKNSYSDAVDIDSGEGSIKNIIFENCGNDCLDLSHSNVDVIEFKSINSGDKAISIGEKSYATFQNLNISKCKIICIAIKDESNASIKDISIKNSKYGIVAFNKKGNYNSPKVLINNLRISNVEINISEENYNSISFNDNNNFNINKISSETVKSFY